MDAVKAALQEMGEQEVKVSFGDLDAGHMYRIRKLERTEALVNGKKIDGIRANMDVGDDAVRLFTYLPNAMKNMKDVVFQAVNSAAEEGNFYGLCLYGSVGSTNIGRIHLPTEDRDENLLRRLQRKRAWGNDASDPISAKNSKSQ